MTNTVLFTSHITSMSTKVDKSIKLTLVTAREMNNEEAAALFALRGMEAQTLLAPLGVDVENIELPKEHADPTIGTKTPSQRLRAVLFRLWQSKGSTTDFESYYRITLESIIDQFKEKLPKDD